VFDTWYAAAFFLFPNPLDKQEHDIQPYLVLYSIDTTQDERSTPNNTQIIISTTSSASHELEIESNYPLLARTGVEIAPFDHVSKCKCTFISVPQSFSWTLPRSKRGQYETQNQSYHHPRSQVEVDENSFG
jgi:hypothetical protein